MDRIHGQPSSMLAYRPEGPKKVRPAGPVPGIMAREVGFTTRDQDGEQNLVRYMSDARQGVDEHRTGVNGTGAGYSEADLFNAGQFSRAVEKEA
jgi:hypothetical protein